MVEKRKIAAIILLIMLMLPIILSPKLIIVIYLMILIILVVLTMKIKINILLFVAPIFVIIVLGLLFSWQNESYNVLKDIWFVGKASILFLLGNMLMENIKDTRLLFKVIVIAASLTSILRLIQFSLLIGFNNFDFIDMRRVIGSGNFNFILGMVIIFACWFNRVYLFNRLADTILLVVCSFATLSSYSRTYWISFIIIFIIVGDFFKTRKLSKLLSLTGIISIVGIFIWFSPMEEIVPDKMSFADKMLYSMQEIKIRDQIDYKDRNINWRGFESYRAILTYIKGTTLQYIFGQGFGTMIDLGYYTELGSGRFRHIPILHNGYLYILIKAGLIGIIVYILYLLFIARMGRKFTKNTTEPYLCATGKLVTGLSFMFLATTLVVSGLFSKVEFSSATIVLGSLVTIIFNRS